MRALRSLALRLARAALWPLYLLLLAYAARVAPWPRSLGILVSAILTAVAIGDLGPRYAAMAGLAARLAGAAAGSAPAGRAATRPRRPFLGRGGPGLPACRSISSTTS